MAVFNNSENEWFEGWIKAEEQQPDDLVVVEILYSDDEPYSEQGTFNSLVYGAGMYNSRADIWYRLIMPEISGELTPSAESGASVVYWRGGNL